MADLTKKKWYQKFPHTYVILFILIVIATILTWIIPAGEFDRGIVGNLTRAQVIPGTYHRVEQQGVGIFEMFRAIPEGLIAAGNIIWIIMISTASFGIIRATGALDNAIGGFLTKMKKANVPGVVTIWITTFLFSILGVVVGPEIQLPFVVLGVSIAIGLGYDAIVGLGIVMGGGYAGFNFGPINASIIGSSHAIMGMQTFSGQGLRWVLWFFATVLVAILTSLYAKKITKNPEKSLMYGLDAEKPQMEDKEYKMNGRQWGVLVVLLLMLAAIGLGYDAIVGLGIVMGGGYAGFNFGPINASIIGSSHAIMGMQTFSGQGLRWVLWFFATVLVAILTSLYAKKITKNPEKSLMYGLDAEKPQMEDKEYKMNGRQWGVLVVLLLMLAAIIFGAAKLGWYLNEMSAVFLIGGLVAGIVYGYSTDEIIKLIQKGVASASSVALIVGIARAIQVVLENGKIMDTIIYALSTPLQGQNPVIGLIFISVITALVHFIIPSGSGLAYALVPIVGPLGILIGCTPQATVLAFQIGATVPNYLYPTIGATMAECGMANVPVGKWWKYAWKMTLLTFILGWVFLFIASAIGY